MQKIAATFHALKDVEKYARVAAIEEIEKAGWLHVHVPAGLAEP